MIDWPSRPPLKDDDEAQFYLIGFGVTVFGLLFMIGGLLAAALGVLK